MFFFLVFQADSNDAVGYVKCKKCGVLMMYGSKRTGISALQRHVDKGCRTTEDAGGLVQTSIAAFATSSKRRIPLQETENYWKMRCILLQGSKAISLHWRRGVPWVGPAADSCRYCLWASGSAARTAWPYNNVKTVPWDGKRGTQKAGGTTERNKWRG